MTNKLLLKLLIFTFIMICISEFATAQRTSTRSRRTSRETEKKETESIQEKLNYEIKFGNPQFFNNTFSLSLKPNVGYKVKPWLSGGLGARFIYTYLNFPNNTPDESFLDLGVFAYGRGKITKSIYIQGEYGSSSVDNGSSRINIMAPLIGGGYMSSNGGNWAYGIELMANINDTARDAYGVVEYWFNVSYKF